MSKNKEQHKIEWFEKIRLNSWEVEILIVGFVLVMLFQVTGSLELETMKIFNSSENIAQDNHSSWAFMLGQIFSIWALIFTVQVLIYSFTTYLIFRGFWVGILGLSSVFPDGINYSKLNFQHWFTLDPKKYSLKKLIISIDNICSSIFSFSFLLSFSVASLLMFLFQVVIIGVTLDFIKDLYTSFNFLDTIIEIILFGYVISGLIFFIDFFLFGVLKKIKWKPFAFIYYYIHNLYKYSTLVFIYDHIYFIFITNLKRRLIIGLFVSYVLLVNFFDPLDERYYFPSLDTKSKNAMRFSYYENKFKFIELGEDASYPEDPFINSDIISSNYLKLHIPYSPEINNSLRDICPEIQNINDFGGTLNDEEQAFEDAALQCINERYIISINDKQFKSDFIFYFYSNQYANMHTYYMVISLDNIDNGKHILSIEKKVLIKNENEEENKGEELSSIKKEWEHKTLEIIPFYVFKD